jgi:DNA-binding winged helix-turn-helix (wHTH) protein/tetratricopeptide (TPR) repeat protein
VGGDGQIGFSGYRLDVEQRALYRGNELIPLTPRSFDLLTILVRNAGRIVSKDEIFQEVWGATIVEDGTLTWHVHALRQALANGDESARYIETVPKRGYRFVAPLELGLGLGLDGEAGTFARTRMIDDAPLGANDEIAIDPYAPAPAPVEPQAAPAPAAERAAPGSHARRASDQRAAKKRLWLWISAAAAVLVAGVASVMFWRTDTEAALPYAKRDWLLIGRFENQTGEQRFDEALLTALTISLEQSSFVNVFPRARIATTLERMKKPAETTLDEALAREICQREGLRALVMPSITRTGTAYAVAARLSDPSTGNTVRAYLIRADDETRVLAAMQELATALRRDLGESIREIDASNLSLERVTTPVLEALRLYSRGVEDWRRGRNGEAVASFEAAVALDPEFAMAQAALGKAEYSTFRNRPDRGNEYFQRALASSGRTTARERQLIAAEFAASRSDVDEARELYSQYARNFPDDQSMHARMGELFLNNANPRDAIGPLQKALDVDPHDAKAAFNIAVAYANSGDFVEAARRIDRVLELDPALLERSTFGTTHGFILFGAGERAKALEKFAAMLKNPNQVWRGERALGMVDINDGHYAAAEKRFRAALDAVDAVVSADVNLSRSRNWSYLASVHAARGQRAEALKALDASVAALDAHGTSPVEFRARLGVAYARLGNVEAAAREIERAAAIVQPRRARDLITVQAAQGELELARGQLPKARELIEAAARGNAGVEQLLIVASLAHVREAAGDTAGAREAYTRLVAVRTAGIGWEAREPWLLAHYELARLLHQAGDVEGARQKLAVLSAEWRDADADVPAVKKLRELEAALATPAPPRA